jgi:hypothetical protein
MLKFGNHKLGDDIAIFNMGTAVDCPSMRLGLCSVANNGLKCYALKAEQQYPKTVPQSRERQHNEWTSRSADELLRSFTRRIEARRKRTSYLRFNESGDFYSQEDIDKLSYIAEGLKTKDITTYGYSARSDLDFSRASFLCKGSGHSNGNNGQCTVIESTEDKPEGYLVCPGGKNGCSRCNLCKIDTKLNIAFIKH